MKQRKQYENKEFVTRIHNFTCIGILGEGGSQKLIDNKIRIWLASYYRFINDSCGDGSDLQVIIKSSLD